MKIFTVLCVALTAILLEDVFAKSNSMQDVAPEDAIRLVLYYRNANTELQYDSTSYALKDIRHLVFNANFSLRRKTLFFFHCLDKDSFDSSVKGITESLMLENSLNIVVFDWSHYSNGLSGFENMPDFQNIAASISHFYWEFIRTGWSASQFRFVGYGSGANLAAAIAREIRKHKPFTIEKITGLDPLLPTSYAFSFERINKDDANLVDIIHTSTFSSEYSGKIDFFPNGGMDQPGCNSTACSHQRAWEFYAESYKPLSFYSMSCKSWDDFKIENCGTEPVHTNMGINADPSMTGNFYLHTNDRSPYSKKENEYQTKTSSNNSFTDSNPCSESSSSSDESNESNQSGKRKNRNYRNRQSNESIRNNKIRENLQENISGRRSCPKSNERNMNKGRNSNEKRQNT